MHVAYRIYSLLCTGHPAFCVLILSLGFQPAVLTLVIRTAASGFDVALACRSPDNNNSTLGGALASLVMEEEPSPLSSLYFLASMSSSGFAMVYLYAMDDESGNDETNNFSRSSDLLFWCFLLGSICISIALPSHALCPWEQLYLRIVLHFGSLFILCGSVHLHRGIGHEPALTLSLLVFLGSCVFSVVVACTQVSPTTHADHFMLYMSFSFLGH